VVDRFGGVDAWLPRHRVRVAERGPENQMALSGTSGDAPNPRTGSG
jgi:hypothetical protein